MVPPSVDPAGAGVEEGEPGAARSSLPTAYCLLPTAYCLLLLPTAYCLLPTARAIGLVGPMSNYAAPPQLVEEVPYRGVAEMHRQAPSR